MTSNTRTISRYLGQAVISASLILGGSLGLATVSQAAPAAPVSAGETPAPAAPTAPAPKPAVPSGTAPAPAAPAKAAPAKAAPANTGAKAPAHNENRSQRGGSAKHNGHSH